MCVLYTTAVHCLLKWAVHGVALALVLDQHCCAEMTSTEKDPSQAHLKGASSTGWSLRATQCGLVVTISCSAEHAHSTVAEQVITC